MRTDETGMWTGDLGMRTGEPGMWTDELGMRTDQPGMWTDHLGMRTDEPGVRTDGPAMQIGQPGMLKWLLAFPVRIGLVGLRWGKSVPYQKPNLRTPENTKNMTGRQMTRAATFGRVAGYAKLHPTDFPTGRKAAELLMIIRQAASDATASVTAQATSGGDTRAGSQTKADLYDELYDDLQAINRTAKSMAYEMPGSDEKFRMPRSSGYGAVLIAARAFLADATPLMSQFIAYEMPEDFLTDLAVDIAAFDAAEDDQGGGLTARVGATRELEEAIRVGTAALRRLDPIIKNKCRGDAGKLAEWITASHIERASRKAKVPPVLM